MKIGYRRVSTLDQNLDRQDIGSLDKVFEEHVSGASAKDRPALRRHADLIPEHVRANAPIAPPPPPKRRGRPPKNRNGVADH